MIGYTCQQYPRADVQYLIIRPRPVHSLRTILAFRVMVVTQRSNLRNSCHGYCQSSGHHRILAIAAVPARKANIGPKLPLPTYVPLVVRCQVLNSHLDEVKLI